MPEKDCREQKKNNNVVVELTSLIILILEITAKAQKTKNKQKTITKEK